MRTFTDGPFAGWEAPNPGAALCGWPPLALACDPTLPAGLTADQADLPIPVGVYEWTGDGWTWAGWQEEWPARAAGVGQLVDDRKVHLGRGTWVRQDDDRLRLLAERTVCGRPATGMRPYADNDADLPSCPSCTRLSNGLDR